MSRQGHTEISLTLPQISSEQVKPARTARCEKEEVMGETTLKIDACDLCSLFFEGCND